MIVKVSSKKPEKNIIQKAAQIIKMGGLVVFPTETVYGLGANALKAKAVRGIFKAKGRPADNPLIVHIADKRDIFRLAKNIPKEALILAKKFWPGPLTLILEKKKIIPFEVTAGRETVAIRMPANKVALALIRASGVPVAAPSANLAGKPSPTNAGHVAKDLGDRVDLIIDGGKTKIGLESTVLDLTQRPFAILRPGGITKEQIEKVVGGVGVWKAGSKSVVKSPGMKYRHYAPKAKLILVEYNNKAEAAEIIKKLIRENKKQQKRVGVMAVSETRNSYPEADLVLTLGSRNNLKVIARNLFKTLRIFDENKIDIILAEGFPEKGIGQAIMNRLSKAADKIIRIATSN